MSETFDSNKDRENKLKSPEVDKDKLELSDEVRKAFVKELSERNSKSPEVSLVAMVAVFAAELGCVETDEQQLLHQQILSYAQEAEQDEATLFTLIGTYNQSILDAVQQENVYGDEESVASTESLLSLVAEVRREAGGQLLCAVLLIELGMDDDVMEYIGAAGEALFLAAKNDTSSQGNTEDIYMHIFKFLEMEYF